MVYLPFGAGLAGFLLHLHHLLFFRNKHGALIGAVRLELIKNLNMADYIGRLFLASRKKLYLPYSCGIR